MLVKSFVLVLISYCLLINSENQQEINELNVQCMNENNLKKDEVAHLNETRHLETNNQNVKCFIKCVLKGLKLINDEGELTLEDPPERRMKYKKHFPKCKNVTGTDPCDKAVNFQNCIWKEIEEEKTAQ